MKLRCFIAIEIPDQIKRKISALKKEIAWKSVSDENMHITLKFLGEIDDKKIPALVEKLKKTSFAPFDVSFKNVGGFPKKNHARVVWVGCESSELQALAQHVQKVFPPAEKFVGHVTIARMEYQDITSFVNAHKDNVFGTMHCTSFVLKKSVLTPKGSIYSTLETFHSL